MQLLTYLREISRRRHVAYEVDDELAFHLERKIQANSARGLSSSEARRVALRDFGGLAQTREATRDVRTTWLDGITRDVRYALRGFRRSPGFAMCALLSLALGIGANTAIFSLINGLLLHRLPVRNPEQLVLVADKSRGTDLPLGVPNQMPFQWNYRLWEQIRQRPDLFQSTCGYFYSRFDLASGGETEFVDGIYVIGGFFRITGVTTSVGRALTDADDQRGTAVNRVAVIGHDFWRRRFDGAPDVIGRALNVERLPFTIVGVLPPGFVGVIRSPIIPVRFNILWYQRERHPRSRLSGSVQRRATRYPTHFPLARRTRSIPILFASWYIAEGAQAASAQDVLIAPRRRFVYRGLV